MKKKSVWIVVTLCTLFLIGGVAACKHRHHPGGFDEFDLAAITDRIASRLDLTESQEADLKQIAREIAEKAKAMYANPETRYQELADLIREDAIASDVVDEIIAEKMKSMQQMADFAAERLIAFHGSLTPEQREMIAVRIESRSSGGCRFGFR